MAFIPHAEYSYPLHVDEWSNYGLSKAVSSSGSITHTEPFFGNRLVHDHPEIGFHLLLAEIQLLTNLDWNNIYRFFPSIFFVFTVACAFMVARRQGYGLEAAFFASMIPTTVRILGPALLVPVSLGLAILLIVLFILHHLKPSFPKALLLFLFLFSLHLIHPPTALAASIVGGSYMMFISYSGWRSNTRWWPHALMLGVVILLAASNIAMRWTALMGEVSEDIDAMMSGEGYPLPLVTDALPKFGYLSLAVFAIGVWFLSAKGMVKSYAVLSYAILFLVILSLFSHFQLGVGLMYDRSWLYFFLFASLVAGAGAKEMRDLIEKLLRRYLNGAGVMSLALILAILIPIGFTAVYEHRKEPYYQMISDREFADFNWIRDNLDVRYDRALLDPWLALTYPPVADRVIYTHGAFIPGSERAERTEQAIEFFELGGIDNKWLDANDISVVYSQIDLDNPGLAKVHDNIYVRRK